MEQSKGKRHRLFTSLPVFWAVFLFCCNQPPRGSVAALTVRQENREVDIEWDEIHSAMSDARAEYSIDAFGANGARFFLELINIRDTGLIGPVSVDNISFRDGLGFHPTKVRSGSIRILHQSSNSISGQFDIIFDDDAGAQHGVNITGAFSITGRD